MDKTLSKLKEISVHSVNNPFGVTYDMFTYFYKEMESERLERDSKTETVERSGFKRNVI